ncbi:MAG: hypothetical protein ACRDL8_14795 [Solirubrobacteraceae bacterium]
MVRRLAARGRRVRGVALRRGVAAAVRRGVAAVVRAVRRRRVVVVVAGLRLREVLRAAVRRPPVLAVRRRTVRLPGRRALVVLLARPTAASNFFSISTRCFSNALSWAVSARVDAALEVAAAVLRRAAGRRAVVRRTLVRLLAARRTPVRALARLVLDLRVVLEAGRAAVRLVPVLLVVRGISSDPPVCFGGNGVDCTPKIGLCLGVFPLG